MGDKGGGGGWNGRSVVVLATDREGSVTIVLPYSRAKESTTHALPHALLWYSHFAAVNIIWFRNARGRERRSCQQR